MLTTTAIILAAGQGKRMQSEKSKVLHEIGGLPMIRHVHHSVADLLDSKPIVVVGENKDEVYSVLGDTVTYAVQKEALGTGHAVMSAVDLLRNRADQVVLMYGDMPLIRKETIRNLINQRERTKATIAMMSVVGEPDSTFGRVLRDENGLVKEVIEWADAKQRDNAAELLAVRELNAGLYCFETEWLCNNVGAIIPRPSRHHDEYYLTDIFRIAKEQGRKVVAAKASGSEGTTEFFGISDKEDLAKAEAIYREYMS